jgi:hypothetical protein
MRECVHQHRHSGQWLPQVVPKALQEYVVLGVDESAQHIRRGMNQLGGRVHGKHHL